MTGSGGEHLFERRKIQALRLVWMALPLAADDLFAADLSPNLLLWRFRTPRAAPAAAQLRSLRETRRHLRSRWTRAGNVHPGGLGLRGALGSSRPSQYDQPDYAHHERRSPCRARRLPSPQ